MEPLELEKALRSSSLGILEPRNYGIKESWSHDYWDNEILD